MEVPPHSPEAGALPRPAGTKKALSPELIAVLAVGVALGMLMLVSMQGIRAEIRDLRTELRAEIRDVRAEIRTVREDLGEKISGLDVRLSQVEKRQARLEGLVEGLQVIAYRGREDSPEEG